MPAQTVIKLRRGTAAAWTSANPLLSAGEMGIETDTQRSKFGDGTTLWNALPYTVGNSSGVGTIDWNSVQNKPSTFTPSAHAASHEFGGDDALELEPSQITGLNAFISDVETRVSTLESTPETTLSDTAPASPVTGSRWIKTTTMQEYVYFDSYWVEI